MMVAGMVGGRGPVLEGIGEEVAELFLRVCTESASDDLALASVSGCGRRSRGMRGERRSEVWMEAGEGAVRVKE